MNPDEVERRTSPVRIVELTLADKMNLTQLAGSPYYDSLKKLCELEITAARDEAMEVSPSDREQQIALMTIAHAMNKFWNHVKKRIEYAGIEHFGEVQAAAAREAMKDQNFIESVILGQ